MVQSLKKSLAEFTPTIISIVLFSALFIGSSGQSSLINKLMLGGVVIIGLLMLIFSKVKQGFGERFFNASLLIAMSFTVINAINTQVYNSFNSSIKLGHFVLDKLLYNFVYTPWQSIFTHIVVYLVVFALFKHFSAKRLTK